MKLKTKKLLKTIFYIFIIVFFAEVTAYVMEVYERTIQFTRSYPLPKYKLKYYDFEQNYNEIIQYMRKPTITESKNALAPIIIFGGSFAHGFDLKDEQTIGYKLSKYTNRSVYNKSAGGFGVNCMLHQLMRDDFYKEHPQPDYVVFVLFFYDLGRMYDRSFWWDWIENPTYKIKNNDLVPKREWYDFLYISYAFRKLNEVIVYNMNWNLNHKKYYDFLLKHMIKCKQEASKHWKNNPKFIILSYDDERIFEYEQKFNEQDISIYFIGNLTGENVYEDPKYGLTQPDMHPREAVWDLVVPAFVKEANIK